MSGAVVGCLAHERNDCIAKALLRISASPRGIVRCRADSNDIHFLIRSYHVFVPLSIL